MEEEETESTLTTLFPGQKKRVSHVKAQGKVSVGMHVLTCLTYSLLCYWFPALHICIFSVFDLQQLDHKQVKKNV